MLKLQKLNQIEQKKKKNYKQTLIKKKNVNFFLKQST